MVHLVLLAMSLAIFKAVQGQEGVRLLSFPSPALYRPGQSISITCTHPVRMEFDHMLHPTAGIISVSTGRFRIQTYSNEANIMISNAMESDEGSYRCVLRDGAAMVQSDPLNTFYRLPVTLTPPNQGGSRTVVAGDSFNLTCDAENFVSRQWVLQPPGGELQAVTNTSDGRITVTSDFKVVFQGIQPADQAEYACVLSNEVSAVRIEVPVTVVVRPVTSVTPRLQRVVSGAQASISCHVTGTPTLAVTWRDRDDTQITATNSELSVSEERQETSLTSTLTIASMSGDLAGEYTCMALNSHGSNSSTAYIQLEGTPDPPANLSLTVVNHTNILVSWDAPDPPVTYYVVTWAAVDGPEDEELSVDVGMATSYLAADLQRLTSYRVQVQAISEVGEGRKTPILTANTTATVPGAPLVVVVVGVTHSSAQVNWSANTLPTDDGGAHLRHIRLTYKAVAEEVWSNMEVVVDVAQMFSVVTGLNISTAYHIRMEVGNEIGFGPATVSESFRTLQPVFANPPTNLVAKNLTTTSAILCWTESDAGRPFFSYNIEVRNATGVGKLLRVNVSQVQSFPLLNCSKGYKVMGLVPGMVYTFVVSITNVRGVGQPSTASVEYHTLDSCDAACNQSNQPSFVLSTGHIAGIAVASVVLLAVVVTLVACLALRQYKKSSLKNNMSLKVGMNVYAGDNESYDSRRDSEQSVRSNVGLLAPHGRNVRSASLNSCDSPQASPDTSTTIISSTDQSPFDFSQMSGRSSNLVTPHSQPVLQPHHQAAPPTNGMEYPQAPGVGSITDQYPIYPILEDPPPYPHHMFPTLVPSSASQPHLTTAHKKYSPNKHYPPATATRPAVSSGKMNSEGVTMMTDNPNYEEGRALQNMDAGKDSMYCGGDHMSEAAESEVSSFNTLQIPTPHFGESYSQSGYSPVMERNSHATEGKKDSDSANGRASADQPWSHGGNSAEKDIDDETEFVENDAYISFAPRFKIVSEERGSVFETVKVK